MMSPEPDKQQGKAIDDYYDCNKEGRSHRWKPMMKICSECAATVTLGPKGEVIDSTKGGRSTD